MSKFYMLIGMQGSGKSTYAENIKAFYLSSDNLRKEFYGDETCQDNPSFIFEEMFKRTVSHLDIGNDVVYDATNINAKRRMNLLNTLKARYSNLELIAIYFNTTIEKCLERNLCRNRKVPKDIIIRTYKSLQVPSYSEGWNRIEIISEQTNTDALMDIQSYNDYLCFLNKVDVGICVEFEQHNPYHSLTVSRHMYDAFLHAKNKQYPQEVQIAALCHDIGKPFCQVFEGKYARYFGHDSVGAQLAIPILLRCGTDKDKILEIVELIQLHMQAHQLENASEKTKNKLKNRIGETQYERLMMLHECDMSTK